MIVYESEMVVFDKHNRCLLSEGEYELSLQERIDAAANVAAAANVVNGAGGGGGKARLPFSPKKHATWENSDIESLVKPAFETYQKLPVLKFRLAWTKERSADLVDRPLPITLAAKQKQHDQLMTSNGSGGGGVNGDAVVVNKNNNEVAVTDDVGGGTGTETAGVDYHFIYNNNTRQQTEACKDYQCPWCSLNCMALYGLLKHLKLCHARLNFTYVPQQSAASATSGVGGAGKIRARIDVCINETFDGSYTGSPHDLVGPSGFAFSRAGPVRRTIVTRILVCRPRRPKPSLAEFLEIDENELNSQRPYITGHNR